MYLEMSKMKTVDRTPKNSAWTTLSIFGIDTDGTPDGGIRVVMQMMQRIIAEAIPNGKALRSRKQDWSFFIDKDNYCRPVWGVLSLLQK